MKEEGSKRREWTPGLFLMSLMLFWELCKSVARGFARVFSGRSATIPPPETQAAAALEGRSTGRDADRNLDLEHGDDEQRRQRIGMLLVGLTFAIGLAAGVGFLYVYWTSAATVYLGGTLALCLGGFGATLVFSTHWLMPHKQAVEPREVLPSDPEQREELLKAYCAGVHDVRRRRLLIGMGMAAVGVLASMFVSLLKVLGLPPGPNLFTVVWKRGQRLMTLDGKPITVDSLQPGSAIPVFPEDSIGSVKSQTMLIRVDEGLLELPAERANWAPLGYVAYSRVCTHAGCPVALFEKEQNLLLCPCHQSTFDVLRAAQPTGGPAARPLPQLPLYADADGTLRAGGEFSNYPGPGFWGLPS